jgi:ABC-type multidrug transport system fused ATPase/permease subunit
MTPRLGYSGENLNRSKFTVFYRELLLYKVSISSVSKLSLLKTCILYITLKIFSRYSRDHRQKSRDSLEKFSRNSRETLEIFMTDLEIFSRYSREFLENFSRVSREYLEKFSRTYSHHHPRSRLVLKRNNQIVSVHMSDLDTSACSHKRDRPKAVVGRTSRLFAGSGPWLWWGWVHQLVWTRQSCCSLLVFIIF